MSKARTPRDFVRDWLNELGLSSYFDALAKDGYDDIRILRDLTLGDEEELASFLGMPRGHARQFSKGLERLRGFSGPLAATPQKDDAAEAWRVAESEAVAEILKTERTPCPSDNDMSPDILDRPNFVCHVVVTPTWSNKSSPRLLPKMGDISASGIEDESTSDGSARCEGLWQRHSERGPGTGDNIQAMDLITDLESQRWPMPRGEILHQYPPPVHHTFVHFDTSSESDDLPSTMARARSCPPSLTYAVDMQPAHRKKRRRKRGKVGAASCAVDDEQGADEAPREAGANAADPPQRQVDGRFGKLSFGLWQLCAWLWYSLLQALRARRRNLHGFIKQLRGMCADSVQHVRNPKLRNLAQFPWVSLGVALLALGILCGGGGSDGG